MGRKAKPRAQRIWMMIGMIIIGIAPMLSVIIAGQIADWNGCGLHEGFSQPCVVFGIDIGELLYTMTVMGWLMLITMLFLAAGVIGLAVEMLIFIGQKIFQRLGKR